MSKQKINNPQESGSTGRNPFQNPTGQMTQTSSGSSATNPKVEKINTHDNPLVNRVPEPLDDENWVVLREWITPLFEL